MESKLLFPVAALLTFISTFVPAAEGSDPQLLSPGLVFNQGFCLDGAYGGTIWPGGKRPAGLTTWGSYCGSGDNNVGRMETQEFLAPATLNLHLAGYPGLPDRRLLLRNAQSGEETELRPAMTPYEHWRQSPLPVPAEWIGKPVQLIGEDRATGASGWLAFTLPLLPASSLLPLIDTRKPQSGFCVDGVDPTTKWPFNVRPAGIGTWGSFCKSGDADTGWAASPAFKAGAYLSLYIAGYLDIPGIRLAAENTQTGQQLLLRSTSSPREAWQLYQFRLPSEWKGQSVRILASDKATGAKGWIGISDAIPEDLQAEVLNAAKIIALTLALALILLIPSVAACIVAALYGIEDLLDLTAAAFLALGFTGYAAFWLYFGSHLLGILFSVAGIFACCAVIVYAWMAPDRRAKLRPLQELIAPGALVILASIFVLSLGLLHGGQGAVLPLAAGRFGPPTIAADNEIPKIFADGVYTGKIPRPLMADWLSSDRPPLQAGSAIWTYPWTSPFGDRNFPYLILSVILQCTMLAALWSFLIACGINRKVLGLTVATCFFSGVTLLNAFYTWPKLFPIGYLLIVAAYLLSNRYTQVRDRTTIGAMLGALAAFAILCHGGSMFALLGIAAGMAVMRRYPGRRFLTAMALSAALLLVPWTLYQKLYDPPGDRLLKWHLGGTVEPRPDVSFTYLLFTNYGKLPAGEAIRYKASNFKALAGETPQYLEGIERFTAALLAGPADVREDAAGSLRRLIFYYWIPSIGLAILAPLALLYVGLFRRQRHGAEFIMASRIWLVTALTLVLWCLLMFGPASTINHQGTYLTQILALAGACLAFWAISPWLAAAAATVQILWSTLLFLWLTPSLSPLGMSVDTGPVNSVMGAACWMAAAAIFALLADFARHRTPRPVLFSATAGLQINLLQHSQQPVPVRIQARPSPPSRPAIIFAALAVVLALWIVVTTIAVQRAGWVAVPILDDWDRWITYVTDHYSLSWFFREHVDHRLVVPKLLFAIDQVAFHGRGWFVLVCSFCIQALTGILLWRLSRLAYRQDRSEGVVLAAVIAGCVFSAQQWMNFILPFQVQFPMVYCFAAAALVAMLESARRNWNVYWMAASIGLATLATYSMANGILIWPVMVLAAVWTGMPRRWLAAIGAAASLVLLAYFYNWHEFVVPGTTAETERLLRMLVFWLGHLGSPVLPLAFLSDNEIFRAACAAIPGALLALALAAGLVMLWHRREQYNSAYAMLVFYCVFLAGSSGMIAYGRSGGELLEMYSSRYLTPSYLFWVSMLLAGWPLLRRAPRDVLYAVLCAAMLIGVAIHQPTVLMKVRDEVNTKRLGETAVVDNVTDPEVWPALFHTPALTLDTIDFLKNNHLAIFTEEWTHWPGIPMERRFFIDRTPGACQGEFEPAMAVTSPLQPGWRASGWAWDNKAGRSPRYLILADDNGLVAGVALAGFPPPPALAALSQRLTASTWNGYINGPSRAITAYLVEADERSLCAIGTQQLHHSGSEGKFTELGDPLPDTPPEITGAWTRDGYYRGPGSPGAPPVDGLVFGSFPDTNTGVLRLGPFHLDGHTEIAIPLLTGPDSHNLSVIVRDAVSKEVLSQIEPPPLHLTWSAWRPEIPVGREMTVEILAEDKGSGWGQWMALGWPHVLRQR